VLQSLDAVSNQQGDGAKDQECNRVLFPVLLLRGIHAAEFVYAPFDWPKEARQRLPVAFQNPKHVDAQRFGYGQDNHRKK
jgi:hypothetical protein